MQYTEIVIKKKKYGMVVFLKLNEINNEIWGWGGGGNLGLRFLYFFHNEQNKD